MTSLSWYHPVWWCDARSRGDNDCEKTWNGIMVTILQRVKLGSRLLYYACPCVRDEVDHFQSSLPPHPPSHFQCFNFFFVFNSVFAEVFDYSLQCIRARTDWHNPKVAECVRVCSVAKAQLDGRLFGRRLYFGKPCSWPTHTLCPSPYSPLIVIDNISTNNFSSL